MDGVKLALVDVDHSKVEQRCLAVVLETTQ